MRNEPLLGSNIKRARAAKKWSQADLSRETGISTTALSAYENDKKRPGLDTLASIASALEVSIDQLYYGDKEIAFITSAPNEGRIIVNCIYELWKQGVLDRNSLFDDDINVLRTIGIFGPGEIPYGAAEYLKHPRIMGRSGHIERLLESLIDFDDNMRSYPRPDLYLEQILESAANNINDEITLEEIPF